MVSQTPERVWSTLLAVLVLCAAALAAGVTPAEPAATRHTEGLVHGFLVLQTLAGETLAHGDLIQVHSTTAAPFGGLSW